MIEPRNQPGAFPQLNIVPVNELLSRIHRTEIVGISTRELRDLLITMVVSTQDISAIMTHRSTPSDPPNKKSQPQSNEMMEAMMWRQHGSLEVVPFRDELRVAWPAWRQN